MMNQEDHISENPVTKDHITVVEFTSKEWNNNASFSIWTLFGFSVGFSVMGLVVALILMIFLPGMRSFLAVSLFSAAFGIIFGFMFQKSEQSQGRTFLSHFSSKINIILTELGGNELQNITPSQLKKLIDSGEVHPLTVDGVAGLRLFVREDRIARMTLPPASTTTTAPAPQQVGKSHPSSKRWQVIIATEAPQYGTESFDRLLDAATSSSSTEQ